MNNIDLIDQLDKLSNENKMLRLDRDQWHLAACNAVENLTETRKTLELLVNAACDLTKGPVVGIVSAEWAVLADLTSRIKRRLDEHRGG